MPFNKAYAGAPAPTNIEEPTLKDLESHAPQDFCPGCPFKGPKVGSKGNPRAPLVFVAESPGKVEVRNGAPLVGPSGKIFHTFIPDNEDIYVLNAMECSPHPRLKDEKSLNVAAHCCHKRLWDKVAAHPRRLVVAMGNPAVRSLTGNYGLKITQVRGKLIPSELATLGIMPVIHIAALMKGTGSFRQWREDVEYALDLGLGAAPKLHLKGNVEIVPNCVPQSYIDHLFREVLLCGTRELTADIETSGLHHSKDRILSIGVTSANDPSVSFCFWPWHIPMLKKWLESPDVRWCWHNGIFDIKFLHRLGVNARIDDDTMMLSYAQDELGGVHDLEQVAGDVLGAPDYKHMIDPYLPNKDSSYALVPKPVLAAYQAIDTCNTAQIREVYRRRVRRDPVLEKLYTETLIPASACIAQVEKNGIQVDLQRIEENHEYFHEQLTRIREDIAQIVGRSINPNSPQQVAEVLFKQLRFPNYKKGSTAKEVLEKLQRQTEHPIFGKILEHRSAAKMYGTYVKGLQRWVHNERIYASYLLHGTRTGRLSSRNPNMQNIPRLAQIRGTFIAAPGYELLEVDLSQAELRSLAALSGDPDLCAIYNSGADLHTELALHLFPGWAERAKAPKDSEDGALAYEQRTKCKNVNFGIVYGITEFGLQGQIGGPLAEARRMIGGWYDRFPVAAEFIGRCRRAPLNNQVITTCFGRRKRVGLVSRENLNFLQNEAANFPHQSIASDITLHAAIRTWEPLLSMGVRIVNLVHDSIIMEVPITEDDFIRRRAIQMVAHEMRQVPIDMGITRVPFISDAEYGHRWGALTKYTGDLYESAA